MTSDPTGTPSGRRRRPSAVPGVKSPGPGLYLHLPFCRRKCRHCDFPSRVGRREEGAGYLEALRSEVRSEGARWSGEPFRSLYVGGGTPTWYPAEDLAALLKTVRESFPLARRAEISMEATPETAATGDLARLRRAGFNRLSLGVQSFQPHLQRFLGRGDGPAEARSAVAAARSAGFQNLNLDLIYGLPGQSRADWRQSLEAVLELQPEHLSLYALEISSGSHLGRTPNIQRELPPEGLVVEQGELAVEILAGGGFERYEISNFARPGYFSRHNLNYWQRGSYLGLGAAAHSFLGGRRFWRLAEPDDYREAALAGLSTEAGSEEPSPNQAALEWLFLRLRLRRGFRAAEFQTAFGSEALRQLRPGLRAALVEGLLERRGAVYRPTDRGLWLENQLVLLLWPVGADWP